MRKEKEFAASSAQQSVLYERARWKHYMRWSCFLIVVLLDSMLVLTLINFHVTHPGAWVTLPRELLGVALVTFLNLITLPSLVFEADKVQVTPDRMIVDNLLFQKRVKWEDITAFYAPRLLKFSIIKTKHFFYLLNKRDMERFDELVQTINHKTGIQTD